MNYTKDEWKLHGLLIETDYAPDGHVIAEMNNIGDKVQADAHLIAAAPDMYEALRELFDSLGGSYIGFPLKVVERVEQALAKAGD